VLKALERDRDGRFQDAMSMAAALQRATPLASALELIQWVEKLAGPELERKAELVRRAEALNWEHVQTMRPTQAEISIAPRASTPRTNWFEMVPVSAKALRGTPTLLGLPKAPDVVIAGSAPVATGESTGVAVGSDRDAPAPNEGKKIRGWKSIGVALGIVLAGSTAALGWLSLPRGERKSSLVVARDVRPLAVAVSASPLNAPSPAVRILQSEPPPAQPVSVASTPTRPKPTREVLPEVPRARAARAAPNVRASTLARRSPSPAARRSPIAEASPTSRGSLSVGGTTAESKPNRRATGTSDTTTPRPSNDGCDPPWTINEQHIKVFKAECLR
jgi:hypothetical protein